MNKIYYFLKENIDTIESFGKGFLTILGILFLVGMCSCSSPITLEQQRFTHNFHVQNGDYYGECMYCNAPDTEVIELQEKLKDYNKTVHRINPDNPEHQRRYQRHLANL